MAGETILIVEDDGILAMHLQDTLRGLGYEVAGPLATGEAAITAVNTQPPDLVLMDIELAGRMSGITAAEHIKSSTDIPVVFLTGYSQDPLLQQAKVTMPYGYLIKPVPERELATTLELALYRYSIDRKLKESEQALRASEERYRLMFQSNVAALALHEIMCDEAGVPRNYRFLQVNPAFEQLTGLKARDVVGRTVLDVLPGLEASWIERYGQVALTGEPLQFEEYNSALGQYFDITAYSPAPGQFAVSFVDVTERRRAEEVLRETLAELTLIHNSVPIAMLLVDRERRVRKANAAAAQFANRTAQEMEGLRGGEALRCLRALDDPQGCGFGPSCATCPVRGAVSDTLATGKSHNQVEACLPIPRGGTVEERCLLISTDYLQIGGLERVLICAQDVTESRQAAQQVKDQMAFIATLLETIPIPVFYKDAAGKYLGCNRATEDLWATTREGIVGKTVYDIQPKEIADSYAAMDEHLFQHPGIHMFEGTAQRVDGAVREVIFYKATFTDADGKLAGLVGVMLDITERKRAEEALRESRELLRAILNSIKVRVFWKDRNLVFLGCNVPFARDAGFEAPEDIIGKDDYAMGWREQAERYRAADRAVIEKGDAELFIEEPQTTPAGEQIHLLTSKIPLRDADGAIVGVLGTYFDITPLKRAEAERERLEAQLRQAQKMEAVGQLAGGVAHDFNNLLQVISGYGEMLAGALSPDTQEHTEIKEILKAAERAGTLVRQLLTFSRREAMQQKTLDLNNLVRNVSKMLRRVIGEHIDLELDLEESPLPLRADPGQLEQVLMNLSVNARDAMPEGGKLVVHTRPIVLDEDFVAAHPEVLPGQYVLLRVSDSGHGMPADVLDHMFEPFFTTKGVGKGTGLGLATVYGIVRKHGGVITCSSEPEKGAVFSIYLRTASEVAERSDVKDTLPEIPLGTETVLFAEDDPVVRKLGRQSLTSGGYRVLAAKDGHEACDLYDAHVAEIALVVLDVVMPGLNGKAVADRIKAHNPRIPILFCSGYDFNMLEGALSSGDVVNVIRKPYRQREFLQRIRELLDQAKGV